MTKNAEAKRIKVFISGGGGDVADAIVDCLAQSNLDLEITVATSRESALLSYNVDHYALLPRVDSDRYVETLIKALKDLEIDIFFPTIASELTLISKNAKEIEKITGSKVFVGQKDMVEIFADKFATINFLKTNNFPYPKTDLLNEDFNLGDFIKSVEYPMIAKPRFGNGSIGVVEIKAERDLELIDKSKHYVIQEKLAIREGEYTAGVFVGGQIKVLGMCVLRRRLDAGSTILGERILDRNIETQLGAIAVVSKLPYVNIQFALRGAEVVPFEINPRFSGTTFMQSIAFNAPEMAITEWVLGEHVEAINNSRIYSARRKNKTEFFDGPGKSVEILSW